MAGISKAERERRAALDVVAADLGSPISTIIDTGVLFRKVGPSLYAAVQVRIENGIIVYEKADHIHDTLDHTASTVATAIAKLIQNGGIP